MVIAVRHADLPRFEIVDDGRALFVRVGRHDRFAPTVMFALLTELTLRTYNIAAPESHIILLKAVPDDQWSRRASCERPRGAVVAILQNLLVQFDETLAFLESVSQRQLEAAIDCGRRRAVADDPQPI